MIKTKRKLASALEVPATFGHVWDQLSPDQKFLALQVCGYFTLKNYKENGELLDGLENFHWSIVGEHLRPQLIEAVYHIAAVGVAMAMAIPDVKQPRQQTEQVA